MKDYTRRLHVTVAGRWFLLMTISVGVVAITTGNNGVYAIESLLLSGLILSGILSEQSIRATDVEVKRGNAAAGNHSYNSDRITVKNERDYSLYCIEIGEWVNGAFVSIAWISQLKPLETKVVSSSRVYLTRGVHSWSAIAIATSFPFGFARKIRFQSEPGTRIVWPSFQDSNFLKNFENRKSDTQQNEVRAMMPEDDYRTIIWTLSDKGSGLVVRTQQEVSEAPSVLLDIRCLPGVDFENRVSLAALPFYRSEESQLGSLTIVDSKQRRIIQGRTQALNALAVVQAELNGAEE